MRVSQLAGIGVTAIVVFGVDLPIDWLVFLAMLCGAFAMALVESMLRDRR
jgi:Na+-transporting NADH:ubiquinone oxidoreductase subunit NqrE